MLRLPGLPLQAGLNTRPWSQPSNVSWSQSQNLPIMCSGLPSMSSLLRCQHLWGHYFLPALPSTCFQVSALLGENAAQLRRAVAAAGHIVVTTPGALLRP